MANKIVVDGVVYCSLREACEKLDVPYMTAYSRMKSGKSIEEIFSKENLSGKMYEFRGKRYSLEDLKEEFGLSHYNIDKIIEESGDLIKGIEKMLDFNWKIVSADINEKCKKFHMAESEFRDSMDSTYEYLNEWENRFEEAKVKADLLGAVDFVMVGDDKLKYYYPLDFDTMNVLRSIVIREVGLRDNAEYSFNEYPFIQSETYVATNRVGSILYGLTIEVTGDVVYGKLPHGVYVEWVLVWDGFRCSLRRLTPVLEEIKFPFRFSQMEALNMVTGSNRVYDCKIEVDGVYTLVYLDDEEVYLLQIGRPSPSSNKANVVMYEHPLYEYSVGSSLNRKDYIEGTKELLDASIEVVGEDTLIIEVDSSGDSFTLLICVGGRDSLSVDIRFDETSSDKEQEKEVFVKKEKFTKVIL